MTHSNGLKPVVSKKRSKLREALEELKAKQFHISDNILPDEKQFATFEVEGIDYHIFQRTAFIKCLRHVELRGITETIDEVIKEVYDTPSYRIDKLNLPSGFISMLKTVKKRRAEFLSGLTS